MEFIKAVILGVVQGLTEFLPISSSGHLVLGAELLGFQDQGVVFEVFLHLGTLVSVLLVFRREIAAMIAAPFQFLSGDRSSQVLHHLRWDIYVVLATLPAVFAGLFIKQYIDQVFASLALVFAMLFITGLMMIASGFLASRQVRLQGRHAVLIGCAQAMAILPGLSRSGSTIFTGMALGIDREVVARFSFIMSVPAILGAVVLQAGEFFSRPQSFDTLFSIGIGTVASAISGYFAIVLLLDIVRKNRLKWFGYYCLVLSGGGAVFLLFFY